MMPVDDRDLRLTIRARNDDGTANGSSCSREVLDPFQYLKDFHSFWYFIEVNESIPLEES